MLYHFTISYADGFKQVSDWLRKRAKDDPLLALGRGFVVVSAAESVAKWQQEQLDAGRSVAEGAAMIEFFPEASTLRVDLECTDAARDAVTNLLADLFKAFPNFTAYDEDRHEDVTPLAQSGAKKLLTTSLAR